MKIGVPAEVKNHEYRVAATPAGVHELVRHGHEVYIQRGAGLGSHLPDEDYLFAGAKILDTADEVWGQAEMILKVKEPIAEEYHRMRAGQVLFTYLHLAAGRDVHRRPARAAGHRHRLRDRPGRQHLAAAARPDVRGRGPAGPAGRRLQPDALQRRPRRAARRRARRGPRQDRRHRRRRLRPQRGADRGRHGRRRHRPRPQRRPAALHRRHLPGPPEDRSSRPPTRSSRRFSRPTWSSARC